MLRARGTQDILPAQGGISSPGIRQATARQAQQARSLASLQLPGSAQARSVCRDFSFHRAYRTKPLYHNQTGLAMQDAGLSFPFRDATPPIARMRLGRNA